MLLAVPNVSEGRDSAAIDAIATAFAGLLDVHSDPEHNRSVLTLSGEAGPLAGALLSVARAAAEHIDMNEHEGLHPCIGALDVCPVVWLRVSDRAAALAEAERAGDAIASELGVPVFFYGELATTEQRRERAFFRQGGLVELRRRMAAGELRADRGPAEPHPTAGATLVGARPPLVAFNIELDAADLDVARAIAAAVRESAGGLPGVRAIGLPLGAGGSQVSINVHDPAGVPLARVVDEVRRLAAAEGAEIVSAEIVGLAPEAALDGFPSDLEIVGFDPARQLIERRSIDSS